MGDVFALKSKELSDDLQLRIMRYNCLAFATINLSDFNENLIILANRSRLPIESAMGTSSLAVYARTHPFARTMEWLFNSNVLFGLFQGAIQDIEEVNAAGPESPLILSLLKCLEVIDLVLKLQRTYFDIVRPLVKTTSAERRPIVANAALASFEDAILSHLEIVTALGLYCSSGHADIAVASLGLLRRMSESRKLSIPIKGRSMGGLEKGRLIVALEKDHEADGISRAMTNVMQYDDRECLAGPTAPGLIMKASILEFLASSLDASADHPSAAHLLLGFSCSARRIFVDESSLFGTTNSLFDAVMTFSSVLPDTDADSNSNTSYLLTLRHQAVSVIRKLWQSPLSAQFVLPELRNQEYLFSQALRFSPVDQNTLWDGFTIHDDRFWTSSAASSYADFLRTRSMLVELAAIELRAANDAGLDSLRDRLINSLLGSTVLSDGQQFANASLFDLLDFVDVGHTISFGFPATSHLRSDMFEPCQEQGQRGVIYDLGACQQVILLCQYVVQQQGQLQSDSDKAKFAEEADAVSAYFASMNATATIAQARALALKNWADLATTMLVSMEYDKAQRHRFVLQLVQLILPKLERSYQDDVFAAEVFAGFALILVRNSNFISKQSDSTARTDDDQERVFELYQACLEGVQAPDGTSLLRQRCTQTCCVFVSNVCANQKRLEKRAVQFSKQLGERLTEVLCDDALGGDLQSRVSSMLLLEALANASISVGSDYLIGALDRYNFTQSLVKYIGNIANELQQVEADCKSDLAQLPSNANRLPALSATFTYVNALLALLARLSQSRRGGKSVHAAGIFAAIRESGVFNADPDLGLDINDTQALGRFYGLMLSILRVVNAIVISQGSENAQTVYQARQFLHAYRLSMVSIFKRNAGIGFTGLQYKPQLNELVDNYTALIVATDFTNVGALDDLSITSSCLTSCRAPRSDHRQRLQLASSPK